MFSVGRLQSPIDSEWLTPKSKPLREVTSVTNFAIALVEELNAAYWLIFLVRCCYCHCFIVHSRTHGEVPPPEISGE